MLSPRFLAVLALVAAVAVAAPPTDNKPTGPPNPTLIIQDDDGDDSPWFSFPLFGNLFAPLWRLLPSFGEIGPKIVADENKFQVVVNVKDYKKDDLKVKVKGEFIFVQGSHEAKHDDRDVFASQFFHTYTLPTNSSVKDVSAELTSDGYLVVSAPLNGRTNNQTENNDREIPIVETGAPYQKPEVTNKTEESNTTIQAVQTTTVIPQKEREPTTTPPKDREEITEKDNNIPHGNEIVP